MEFEIFGFDNGIKCVYKRVRSKVVHCGLIINTGTRDELPHEHGMAHLIEHMMFKGTGRRKPYHINNLLDSGGGELNAFTSKEETVIHTTTLRSDFAKATDLIQDIAFHSVFPETALEKERNVIIEEINSCKDSPSEQIFDDFEDLVFSGSSLGRNILGSRQPLKRFRQKDLFRFVDRCYNTDQMVFSIAGDLPVSRVKEVCRKALGSIPENIRTFERPEPPPYVPFQKTVRKNTHQVHGLIGNRAYPHNHPGRIALALLINMLGGPSSNARLNVSLREKNGLSYHVEAGVGSYADTGIVTIYFGADKQMSERCFELIRKELSLLRNKKISPLQLSRAKKQLIGQLAISCESNESYMLSAGKSYLIHREIESLDALTEKILAVTPEKLLETANDIFCESRLSTLIYK